MNILSQPRTRQRIARSPTAVRTVADAETGVVAGVAGAAVSVCRNPNLPGQPQNHRPPGVRKESALRETVQKETVPREQVTPTAQKEALAPSVATAPNTVLRRDTNPSCSPESRSRSISAWHRIRREPDLDRRRRIRTPPPQSPTCFQRTSRYLLSPKLSSIRQVANESLMTEPKARPQMLKSDLPSGIVNKSDCTR